MWKIFDPGNSSDGKATNHYIYVIGWKRQVEIPVTKLDDLFRFCCSFSLIADHLFDYYIDI